MLENIGLVLALVHELDAHAGVEKRELAQPLGQDLVIELDVGKDLRARLEAHHRASLGGLADDSQRRDGIAQVILLAMHLPVPVHGQQQSSRTGR